MRNAHSGGGFDHLAIAHELRCLLHFFRNQKFLAGQLGPETCTLTAINRRPTIPLQQKISLPQNSLHYLPGCNLPIDVAHI